MAPKIALPHVERAGDLPEKGVDAWLQDPDLPFQIAILILVLIGVVLILLIIFLSRSSKLSIENERSGSASRIIIED